MKGVFIELTCALLLATTNSAELRSKMEISRGDQYIKNAFRTIWPNDVRSYLVAITNTTNKLICMGIFHRRNAFITNSECFIGNSNPIVFPPEHRESGCERQICGHDFRRSLFGVTMEFVTSWITFQPNCELNNPQNLFYFDKIPESAILFALGCHTTNSDTDIKLNTKICYFNYENQMKIYVTQQNTNVQFSSIKGEILFYNEQIIGIFHEYQMLTPNGKLAVYKRIKNSQLWFI